MKFFSTITIATAATLGAFFTFSNPAQAFGLSTLVNAAAASVVQPVVAPRQSLTNSSHASGRSEALGGNGTNVSGQGNTVSTNQVTNIHHHHYTAKTTNNNAQFTNNLR